MSGNTDPVYLAPQTRSSLLVSESTQNDSAGPCQEVTKLLLIMVTYNAFAWLGIVRHFPLSQQLFLNVKHQIYRVFIFFFFFVIKAQTKDQSATRVVKPLMERPETPSKNVSNTCSVAPIDLRIWSWGTVRLHRYSINFYSKGSCPRVKISDKRNPLTYAHKREEHRWVAKRGPFRVEGLVMIPATLFFSMILWLYILRCLLDYHSFYFC